MGSAPPPSLALGTLREPYSVHALLHIAFFNAKNEIFRPIAGVFIASIAIKITANFVFKKINFVV